MVDSEFQTRIPGIACAMLACGTLAAAIEVMFRRVRRMTRAIFNAKLARQGSTNLGAEIQKDPNEVNVISVERTMWTMDLMPMICRLFCFPFYSEIYNAKAV